jgi:RHS repeat-associated protein
MAILKAIGKLSNYSVQQLLALALVPLTVVTTTPLPAATLPLPAAAFMQSGGSQVSLTLSASPSPTSGQPGVTVFYQLANNFPAGNIQPANVTVSYAPVTAGAGPSGTTLAQSVTTVIGTTRRVSFQIPATVVLATPTPYWISLSGTADSLVTFISGNKAQVTLSPPASLASLAAISPSSGGAGQQVQVTITGLYTSFFQGSTVASFGPGIAVGGAAAGAFGPVTVSSPTVAVANLAIGAGATLGAVTVTVETGVQTETLSNGFTILPQPSLTQLSPTSGYQGQTGLAIAITGVNTHFTSASAISLGAGITVSNVVASGSTQLTAVLSISASTTATVRTLTVTSGQEVVALYNSFTVTGPPTLLSISPNSGQVASTNLAVTIVGQNTHFTNGSEINLGPGIAVLGVVAANATHLTAQLTIEATAAATVRTLTVTSGSEVVQLANAFTVIGPPYLVAMTPHTAPQGETNVPVTITGQNTHFTNASVINLGEGVTLASVVATDSTDLVAQMTVSPTALVMTRDLTVTSGTEVVTLPGVFTVMTPAPALLTLAPNSGQPGTSLSIAITGQNTHFSNSSAISLGGGITASNVTASDSTHLAAQIAIASGAALTPRTLTVTTGSETVILPNSFTVTNAATSWLVSVTPNHGNPAQNLTIAIVGQNTHFTSSSTVSLGAGITVSNVAATDGSHLSAQIAIASSAATTTRAVVVSSGTEVVSLAGGFTVGSISQGSSISITVAANTTVTFPNTLLLTGTITDTALPAGHTVVSAWSEVSGPGTITYADPTNPVTNASFSAVGTYVLQLAATDGVNGAVLQFPITVNPPSAVSQGWFGSPTYGSSVSGQVPITVALAPGVTLVSGTLTYAPASNPTATQTLNADTTGNGTIGVFDTTLLPDGEYWIQLSATDSNGNYQTNLILLTVIGDYKPGRVMATITDLVVPAIGMPIQIQRTYDSLVKNTSSDFGYGWSLSVTVDLVVSPSHDVTFTLNGKRRTFNFTPRFLFPLFPQIPIYLPAFTPEAGMFGTLTASLDGCYLVDFLVPAPGNTFGCASQTPYTPSTYTYMDPYGRQYVMGSNGTLESIHDLHGNTLTVTPAGISSTGLSVPFVRDSQNRITEITDTLGNNYLYGYDANGNLASVTYPNVVPPATPTAYTYDPTHLITGGLDSRGNALPTTQYYPDGRLKSVTDALGQTTSYAYDLTTNTTTTTFPDGGVQTVQYDSYGMVLSTTDPLNHTTTNVYDANHDLISVTDPLGHTTSYTYDSNGNKLSQTYPKTATSANTTRLAIYNQFGEIEGTKDELGNVVAYAYDGNFNPSLTIDYLNGTPTVKASFIFNPNATMQAGAVGYDITASPANFTEYASQYTYDANGNLTGKTDALGRQTSYTYDLGGDKLTQTDPSGAITTFQYDSLGNLTGTSAPLGRTTSSQYDANANKISDTDANGHTTTYQYDALNRLTTTTYPTAPPTTSTLTYDFRNNVVNATDQAGNVTHNDYDLAGRLIATTKAYSTANASRTTYTYYADGTKQTQTDPRGNTTTYTYDAAGRLIAVTDAAGNQTQYGYDDAGNRISITDANGHTTQFQYDCRRRLVKTIYPDSTSTTNTYDGPGNLTGVTDQAGNTVQYTFDVANQLSSVIQVNHPNPAHNTTAYGYDNNGNLTAVTDDNGHSTATVFNVLNELTATTLPDGVLTETRAYDPAGNLVTLGNFNGKTTAYAYDPLNRLLSKTPDPSLGEPIESFTYTPTGKRATMTDASGLTTYAYDNLDRLTSKTTPQGTLSYTYDAVGNVASMASSNPNGISASYTYDQLNRLATVVDNHLTPGHNTTTYTYDPVSNLATATYPNGQQSTFSYDMLNRLTALNGYTYQLGPTGNRQSATEPSGRTANWSYDGIYRLTNETIANAPNSKNGSVGYGLDPVGNRLSEASTLSGIQSGTWSYNADDQVSTETYDNNGNTIISGARTFAYDFENRLKSMNNGAVRLVYDGNGDRVAKTVGGTTTQYLVDDLNPTGYAQVVEELVGGAVQRRYTYGLQRISQTQFLNSAWTTSFYGYDGLGSVRQLTGPAGAVTDTYDYDAWGNAVNVTGSTPNVYLYRGEQYDPDLNLYYLRARYFNPLTGRFLTRDPAEGQTVDPRTLHKYLYAGGDPVNALDPTGRDDDLETYTRILSRVMKAYPAILACSGALVGLLWTVSRVLAAAGDQNDKAIISAGMVFFVVFGCGYGILAALLL